MRTLKFLYLSLVAFFLLSCGDDDKKPSYNVDLFLGEWKLVNSTNPEFISCPNDPPIALITETEIDFPVFDTESGCDSGGILLEYMFDGRAFKVEVGGFNVNYSIISASENQFKWKNNYDNYIETYVPVN